MAPPSVPSSWTSEGQRHVASELIHGALWTQLRGAAVAPLRARTFWSICSSAFSGRALDDELCSCNSSPGRCLAAACRHRYEDTFEVIGFNPSLAAFQVPNDIAQPRERKQVRTRTRG